ncbi:MAG: peptide deformylase [bacterium]|nr:peptide deformylase [bacterium]
MLNIKKYPDPILKKIAEPVTEIGPAVWELIRQMKEMLGQGQEDGVKGVGLAAPQVGISKKIIVVSTKEGLKGFINPEVISSNRQKEKDKEGCLSLPGLWLNIRRAKKVKISALDEKGEKIEIDADRFLARVFQHEIDHLNGILFFERLPFWQKWLVRKKLKF